MSVAPSMRGDWTLDRPDALATDYQLADADAKWLAGVVCVPGEFRRLALARYLEDHGTGALVRMFAQFIGAANSVIANGHEFAETELIVRGGMHPESAGKLNWPTLMGAMQGVQIAQKPTRGMCQGCAYRLGTHANQSPSTTLDAESTLADGSPFMCHEHLSPGGEPTRRCAGHAKASRLADNR